MNPRLRDHFFRGPTEQRAAGGLRKLSDEIRRLGVRRIALLKVDVEGAELEVRSCGASGTLQLLAPRCRLSDCSRPPS